MNIKVYLSGEIHSNWRNELIEACSSANLPITFMSPIVDHDTSDNAGKLLGDEQDSFWHDHKSAKINAIRIRTMIDKADIVIVKFGKEYKQWNAAFDAGYAAAKAKPIITLHPPELNHPLKEVDAAALATAQRPEAVANILKLIIS